jgi:glycosyltransferase involved in cell wall biosynthesis
VAAEKACPLVISPHGTLTPWALGRSHHLKRLIAWNGQQRALNSAACFHVTAASELEDLRNLGYRQPVAVIPNGVDLPPSIPIREARDGLQILFLSRLHPKKGLDLLLKVWQDVEARHPRSELVVAGPDEAGYGTAMQKLAQDLGLRSVRFVGPLIGSAKQRAFSDADLYVLPTHSENFGLTVAEALAAGTPAITTTGAPWSGLVTQRCGWWIERGERELALALEQAHLAGPAELTEMGQRGRAWVAADFAWSEIARKMRHLYQWLEGSAEMPDFVSL